MAEVLDIATFGFAIDDSLASRGAQKVVSALNQIEAKANAAIATVEKVTKAVGNIAQLGQQIRALGLGLTIGLTAPFLGLGKASLESAVKMDAARRSLTAVSGSAKEAERQIARLREVAKLPGIDFQGAIEGSTRLQAVGFSANTAERALKGFANAIAQTGGGAAQLNSVTVQLGQMASKSKVLGQDLRPIIEAAPVLGKVLKQAFGTVDSEAISEKLSKAGKTSSEFIEQIIGLLEKLPKVGAGAREIFDNLGISVTTSLGKIGESILVVVAPALTAATDLIDRVGDKFAALPSAVKTTLVVLAAVAAAVGPIVLAFGGLLGILPSLVAGWASLTTIMSGAALPGVLATLTAFGPVVLGVAAVLGVATAAWLLYESATEKASKVTTELLTQQVAQISKYADMANATKAVADSQSSAATQGRALQVVLLDLDPATRSYINAITDGKDKTEQLADVIQSRLLASQQLLGAEISILSASYAEQTGIISENEERVLRLTALINSAATSTSYYDAELGTMAKTAEQVRDETLRYGQSLEDVKKLSADAKEKTLELGGKVFALSESLKKTGKSFDEEARAAGKTEAEIRKLNSAAQLYVEKQATAGSATSATTKRINEQEEAVRGLAAAVASLDVKGIQSGVNAKLDQIREQAMREGKGVSGALALFDKARGEKLPGSDLTLGDTLRTEKQAADIKKALDEARNPTARSRGGGGGRSSASSAATEVKDIAAAKASAIEEALQREVEIYKKATDYELQLQESMKEAGTVSIKDYFANRLLLTEGGIQREIAVIQNSLKQQELAYKGAKTGSSAQLEATNKITGLISDQIEKYKDLTRAQATNFSEYKKAYASVFNQPLDLSQQLQVAPDDAALPKVYREAKQQLEALRDLQKQVYGETYDLTTLQNAYGDEFSRASAIDQQLRIKELDIQQQIYRGVLTETEGRKVLLATQRQYRDAMIEAYQAELERAESDQNFDKIGRLQEQIQGLKTLGEELNNTQRFLKGLGDTLDPGDIFQGLGNGLRDVLRTGFEDGFGKAGESFTKLLKRLAAELITSEVVKIIRNLFNPSASSGSASSPASSVLQSGGTSGGGNIFQKIQRQLGIGGGSGSGGYSTPGYNGGPGGGAYSTSGGSGGGGGFSIGGINLGSLKNLKGIASKIPVIGKLFGPGASSVAGGSLVNANGTLALSSISPAALGGLSNTTSVAQAGIAAGAAPAGAVSGLASAGAGGLLLAGGYLGSLAGGKSPTGRLIGGIGGTLGAGFLGASGVFGSTLAAALPALLSNPITAIVAGGLIATALIIKWFKGRDFSSFKKATKSVYDVDVKGDATGQALFKQVKELGEQSFGKGSFRKKVNEIVKLDQSKALIGSYAETTGQTASKLGKNAAMMREIQDPASEVNRFTKRAFGGSVTAGRPYVVGDGFQPEVFVPDSNGEIHPSASGYQRQATESMFGMLNSAVASILAQAVSATDSGGSQPANNGRSQVQGANIDRMIVAAIERNTEELSRLAGIPPEHLVGRVLPQMGREIGNEVRNQVNNDGRLRADLANRVLGN